MHIVFYVDEVERDKCYVLKFIIGRLKKRKWANIDEPIAACCFKSG